jgi:succinyl-CoA synthetase beta subunit
MKIHEYQAKELLREFGVPVERGVVAHAAGEIDAALNRLGRDLPRYVVKAQVHAGGRGKGHFADGAKGGVQLVPSAEEAGEWARRMLGNRLITRQSGPEGKPVSAVYIAEAVEAEQEFYLSVLIDRAAQGPVILASAEGGVEIEKLAEEQPEKIYREYVDPMFGLEEFQIRRMAFALGLGDDGLRSQFVSTLKGMYRIFWEKNASLVEINPLVRTADGRLYAIDGKINFEDNGLIYHGDIGAMRDPSQEDPKEVRAAKYNLSYIALDGTVACLTNGAGLAMATMDMLDSFGVRPANFLDLGDNSGVEAVAEAFRILCADGRVRCLLVNIFGGAMRGDMVADGIITALGGQQPEVPLVVRIEGARAEEGKKRLSREIMGTVFADDFADVGRIVQRICKK